MSRLGVVTNPTAASGRGARWGAEALDRLAFHGHDVVDLTRESWRAARDAAEDAAGSLDALVVVGGDGMAHLGAQVCAERDLPLGVIAAGSGNDLATALELPVHHIVQGADAVAAALAAGTVRTIDLGKVTAPGLAGRPRYFAGVLSAGIDAAIAARGMRMTFPRGPLKYKVAIGLELPRFRPYGARVSLDGAHAEEEQYTLVAIANGTTLGGGIPLAPGASLEDGVLDVVTAEALTLPQIAAILPKLQRGEHVDHPAVTVRTAREVTLAPGEAGGRLPTASADGELVTDAPLKVSVVPGALHVVVPPHD
ncbi:diacylglycerol kinase family protein [Demequina sp. NBRC 110055]|uniref:diacylglycerol/lipid kinase family protein n=1 Tax=Demequina sp. NBRC 110055 TaxID=1570344 RepID=UPI00135658AB|nr:diacylglycerol kinase family protein [Demequina sp. NBRC 110055]